jgi:stress response protein YsnF
LAAILSSAAAGAAAAGIAGALVGLGIPKDEAEYYEGEFQSGRTLVTVKGGTRNDEALRVMRQFGATDITNRGQSATGLAGTTRTGHSESALKGPAMGSRTGESCTTPASTSHAGMAHAGKDTLQAKEEQLHVSKEKVQTGGVDIRKEVHTEHKTIEVPVEREEVVVEVE